MSSTTSNRNINAATFNTAGDKENLTYMAKFGLPPSVAQHINLCLISKNIHIDDLMSASNMKLNSWIFYFLEIYYLRLDLFINIMLEVCRREFYKWEYMEFGRLKQHIKQALNKTLITKQMYRGQSNGYVN